MGPLRGEVSTAHNIKSLEDCPIFAKDKGGGVSTYYRPISQRKWCPPRTLILGGPSASYKTYFFNFFPFLDLKNAPFPDHNIPDSGGKRRGEERLEMLAPHTSWGGGSSIAPLFFFFFFVCCEGFFFCLFLSKFRTPYKKGLWIPLPPRNRLEWVSSPPYCAYNWRQGYLSPSHFFFPLTSPISFFPPNWKKKWLGGS